jgi:xylulokinase
MDKRSQPEAQELEHEFGAKRVLELSGQPEIGPIWPVTKFRWLSKHAPEATRRTVKYLLPADYLLYRLSGRFAGDPSMWSSSLVLDISRRQWSSELMTFGGVRQDQLPELLPSGTAIGHVSRACAEETGLSTRTQVVTGGLDQTCAAIGAGNIEPGMVTESTGSVLALLATIPKPVFDLQSKVPCHIHAVPGKYCLLPWNPTGGLALKWFKDRFAKDLATDASSNGRDVYDLLTSEACAIPAGCEGLVMLPHMEGAFFPEFDAAARGVFFGFTLNHGRAHFTRAIMEAVAFMIRRDLEGLACLGVTARELRVLGGGAKSRLWSQIKADVTGIPVVVPSQGEAAALGCAILAAVGVGLYPDLASAVGAMVSAGSPVQPIEDCREAYRTAFELYVKLYESVKDLYAISAALARRAT